MQPISTTKLGSALSGAATSGPAANAFQRALAGSRVCEPYELQLTNGVSVPCVMTLVGTEQLLDIEGDVRKEMEARSIPNDHTTQHDFELARARRIMALSVRELDEKKRADAPQLGTVAEWGTLAPEIVIAAYSRYNELREIHDPLAGEATLTKAEYAEMVTAIEKKNLTLLRYCGVRKLTALLLTMAEQLASLQTPKSEPGDSSPES